MIVIITDNYHDYRDCQSVLLIIGVHNVMFHISSFIR